MGDGRVPGRTGNAHPNIYPYDAFPTATVAVFLAVDNDRQFQQLCTVLGDADLAGQEALSSAAGRSVHRARLREKLLALMARFDGLTLVEQLGGEKACPVLPYWMCPRPCSTRTPNTAT